jgi:hypothetical protein
MAFFKSITSRPVGWIAHKSVGKSAHCRERWVLQREIRVGVKLLQLLPPPTNICLTHRETGVNRPGKRNHMAFWT